MAAGMTELLQCLPKNHKDRPRILEGYRTMMESLKKYQNPEGLWNQLIDQSDCWTETSGSAMFTFAFIKGVKNGWLNAERVERLIKCCCPERYGDTKSFLGNRRKWNLYLLVRKRRSTQL